MKAAANFMRFAAERDLCARAERHGYVQMRFAIVLEPADGDLAQRRFKRGLRAHEVFRKMRAHGEFRPARAGRVHAANRRLKPFID